MIRFENRHVSDIGGNVADTALYFAKEGATVIGFEPIKHLYNVGLENISLNPDLENRITFINYAVGGKKGKLNINTESTSEYVNDESYEIEVISVSDVLNNYEFPADVLKMDCEGCEFEIIEKEDLSMFNDVFSNITPNLREKIINP